MLDKAEYSAFQSTLNSTIVSYRIVLKLQLDLIREDNPEREKQSMAEKIQNDEIG